jgi:hypothetical protein
MRNLLIGLFVLFFCIVQPVHASSVNPCDMLDEKSDVNVVHECKATCEKSGGLWGGVMMGRGRSPGCHAAAKDAGKACEASDQCEGGCDGDGRCAKYVGLKGCFLMRNPDGKSVSQMCVE